MSFTTIAIVHTNNVIAISNMTRNKETTTIGNKTSTTNENTFSFINPMWFLKF